MAIFSASWGVARRLLIAYGALFLAPGSRGRRPGPGSDAGRSGGRAARPDGRTGRARGTRPAASAGPGGRSRRAERHLRRPGARCPTRRRRAIARPGRPGRRPGRGLGLGPRPLAATDPGTAPVGCALPVRGLDPVAGGQGPRHPDADLGPGRVGPGLAGTTDRYRPDHPRGPVLRRQPGLGGAGARRGAARISGARGTGPRRGRPGLGLGRGRRGRDRTHPTHAGRLQRRPDCPDPRVPDAPGGHAAWP